MEMLPDGKEGGERERERERERESRGEKRKTEREEGRAVIQGLSVNSDNASPRRLETEITANRRAIINASHCF